MPRGRPLPKELCEFALAVNLLKAQRFRAGDADVYAQQRKHVASVLEYMEDGDLVALAKVFLREASSGALAPERMREMEEASLVVVHAGVRQAPQDQTNLILRLHALQEVPWIGSHASNIQKGWVPLFERIADLVRDAVPEDDQANWKTNSIQSNCRPLNWRVSGGDQFEYIAALVEEASRYFCVICGDPAREREGERFALTFCDNHKEHRTPDEILDALPFGGYLTHKQLDIPHVWPDDFYLLTLATKLLAVCQALNDIDSFPDEHWLEGEKDYLMKQVLAAATNAVEQAPDAELRELATPFLSAVSEGSVSLDQRHDLSRAAKDIIFSHLEAAPQSSEEYLAQIAELSEVPWLGKWAFAIPQGWLPIFARVRTYLESLELVENRAQWGTSQVKEKWGTLRWYTHGSKRLWDAAKLAQDISAHCCYVCGKEGDLVVSGWVLTLCPEHKQLRESDLGAFRIAARVEEMRENYRLSGSR